METQQTRTQHATSPELKQCTGKDEGVYQALAEHQCTESTWDSHALLAELHRWAAIFNDEFKLQVPEYSLRVDWLRRSRLGHFQPGHNGFGLRGEIAINRRHLGASEPWQPLGTLLHEMLHAWQQAHGKPGKRNYHNKQFREKARVYGLLIDHRGVTHYEVESPFVELLREHGVHVPPLPAPEIAQRGHSKLKKWSCGCTNVRVAVSEFRALCLRCGQEFQRLD